MRYPLLIIALAAAAPAPSQTFLDTFDRGPLVNDPAAREGWSWFTGDGEATMSFTHADGLGMIKVDATHDRRGIWWALIKRSISGSIATDAIARPDRELHIEARVRSHTAPRRLNLSVNHTRTTDYDSNLAEFDLPDTDWHVISFTTHGFDAKSQDEVFAQLAMMDWGIDRFQVDIDYFKVTLVDPKHAPPDQGGGLPYRPPIEPLASFREQASAVQDGTIDAAYPWVNFHTWADMSAGGKDPLLATSGSQTILLRFDLSAFKRRKPSGWGVLELTTENVAYAPTGLEEFGYLRCVEVLGGDPDWRRDTVTQDSFLAGRPRGQVLGQMFMDTPPAFLRGAKTLIHISPPVLARLMSGEAKGIAIYAQGAVTAAFYSSQASDPSQRPVLHFNVK